MHIVFLFPLMDLRYLLPEQGGKLPLPGWPEPSNPKAFIRQFGAVIPRKAGGNKDFLGESYYCNARRLLQFKGLEKNGPILQGATKASIFNCYRRFYSDGKFVNKLEVGFVDNTERMIQAKDIQNLAFNAILSHYADLPITIDKKEYKLLDISAAVAKQYYYQSSGKTANSDPKKNIIPGETCMIITVVGNQALEIPGRSFMVEKVNLPYGGAAEVHGYWFRHNDQRVKTWIIKLPAPVNNLSSDSQAIIRNIRVYLSRIHVEKESLRLLLNSIKSKTVKLGINSKEAKNINIYFKKIGEKIFKKNRFTIETKNYLDFAVHSEEEVNQGWLNTIKEMMDDFENEYLEENTKDPSLEGKSSPEKGTADKSLGYLKDNLTKLAEKMSKKMVLFICACPKDKNPLKFLDDYSNIDQALTASINRNNFDLKIVGQAKADELIKTLNRHKPDFIHFSMHSSIKQGLYFVDGTGQAAPMNVEDFKEIMALYASMNKPISVVLSACNSKLHGLAIKEFCQYVVATNDVFPDDAGVVYTNYFYDILFNGNDYNIPYCHDAAVLAIKQNKPPFPFTNNKPTYSILEII